MTAPTRLPDRPPVAGRLDRRRRLAVFVAGVLALSLAVPGAVLGAPSEDSCAAYASYAFSTPLPEAMRTTGLHHVQWHLESIDGDGNPQVLDTENQVEIVPGTPLYAGQVLVRLFTNWAALSSHDVDFDVHQIDPSQPALLYAIVADLRGTPNFDSNRLSVRWEGAPGAWSDWLVVPRSPATSYCAQHLPALFHRSNGWAG